MSEHSTSSPNMSLAEVDLSPVIVFLLILIFVVGKNYRKWCGKDRAQQATEYHPAHDTSIVKEPLIVVQHQQPIMFTGQPPMHGVQQPQPGYSHMQPGFAHPGYTQPTVFVQPGMHQQHPHMGFANHAFQPGMPQPNYAQPGYIQPGMPNLGFNQTGMQAGFSPSMTHQQPQMPVHPTAGDASHQNYPTAPPA